MRGRIWPWLLLVIAFLPALLIHEPQAKLQPVVNHVFTEAIFQNPNNLDPALASNSADWQVASNVFQTLLDISPSGTVVPGLASSVTYHGVTVTIRLRHLTLSNGELVTPDMVAKALVRPLVAPIDSSTARTLLADVVGVKRFEQGKTQYLQGIQVTGPNSLQLTLKHPAGVAFLKNLANPALAIVPVSDQAQGGANWQFMNLIGSGGYKLIQWTPHSALDFSKVSGTGPQAVDLVWYPSLSQALLAYQNHLVNAVPLNPGQLSQLTTQEVRHVEPVQLPGVISLYVNTAQKHLTLPQIAWSQSIRQAFRGSLKPLTARYRYGTATKSGASPLTIWVSNTNPEALKLASTLQTRYPHQVAISPTSSTNLTHLARSGKISAYLGIVSQFPHSLKIPLVPESSFWLFSQGAPHAIGFENQVLDWHSVP